MTGQDSGRTALQKLEAICDEIFERWDKDQRSGKLLSALAGRLPGYRADVDEVRAALTASAAPQPEDSLLYKSPPEAATLKAWLAAAPQGGESGWKLVPVEPTREMLLAGESYGLDLTQDGAAEVWHSMIAAAPSPSPPPPDRHSASM